MKKFVLILLMFISVLFAEAENENIHPIDQWYSQCMEQAVSTFDMNECSSQAFKKWDAELNRVYKELRSQLDSTTRINLRDSQRAWNKFKEAESVFIGQFYGSMGGTMWNSVAISDKMEITRKRTLELINYLKTLE